MLHRYPISPALLAGCLLMAAMAGCQFHRPRQGGWFAGPDLAGHQTVANRPAEPAKAGTTNRPELLPWRTRLKDRLAARIFHRKGLDGTAGWAGSGSAPSPALATPRLPPPPEEPNDGDAAASSAGIRGLQIPANALLTPEPRPRGLVAGN